MLVAFSYVQGGLPVAAACTAMLAAVARPPAAWLCRGAYMQPGVGYRHFRRQVRLRRLRRSIRQKGLGSYKEDKNYRKEVYQCNEKYKGTKRSSTPHMTEEQIKVGFLVSFNKFMENRSGLIEVCRLCRLNFVIPVLSTQTSPLNGVIWMWFPRLPERKSRRQQRKQVIQIVGMATWNASDISMNSLRCWKPIR